MRPTNRTMLRVCTALAGLFLCNSIYAQPTAADDISSAASESISPEAMQQKLLDQMADINAQYRKLLEQVDVMDSRRRELEMSMLKMSDLSEYRAGTDTSGAAPDVAPAAVGNEQRKELEAQQNQIPELPRVSEEVGGVLTPRGRLIAEPSMQFLNNSITRVNVRGLGIIAGVIGDVDVRSVERESLLGSLTARYGVTNRLEAEIKASWLTRDDRTTTRPLLEQSDTNEIFNASGSGLGDIEFGLRYQFAKRPNLPYLIGNLRVKSVTGTDPWEIETREQRSSNSTDLAGDLATGSGFWSINPSLTFVYPTDPVAIFGNIGYLYTFEDDKGTFAKRTFDNVSKDFEGFGTVDPGDALRFNFGMGIALNQESSISFSYALDLFNQTQIGGQDILGSDVTVGKFIVGYSFSVGKGTPISLAVGMGTTDAAPDTDVTLRVPFTLFD